LKIYFIGYPFIFSEILREDFRHSIVFNIASCAVALSWGNSNSLRILLAVFQCLILRRYIRYVTLNAIRTERSDNITKLKHINKKVMDNNNKTIHDFDFQLICEYFSSLKRQGPGSEEVTLKALSFIENLPADAKIADIGCGTGGQTITLAQNTTGHITAIDLFPQFIDILNINLRTLNLEDRVTAITGTMAELPFEANEMDLIWTEGSIYNIGFEYGIGYVRQFLKEGGYLAVSEGTWFTQNRPAEIENFWMGNYAEIDTVSAKAVQIEKAGYTLVAAFILPENCWIENYFDTMGEARRLFVQKYPDNETVRQFIASQQYEESLYLKYKDYYGYTFYIARKISK